MGLKVRKTKSLGKHTRATVSKSGIGVSVGGGGVRRSVHSSGRRTTTVGVPGTGVYYSKSKGGSRRSKSSGAGCAGTLLSIIILSVAIMIIFPRSPGTSTDSSSEEESQIERTVVRQQELTWPTDSLNIDPDQVLTVKLYFHEFETKPADMDDGSITVSNTQPEVCSVELSGKFDDHVTFEITPINYGVAYLSASCEGVTSKRLEIITDPNYGKPDDSSFAEEQDEDLPVIDETSEEHGRDFVLNISSMMAHNPGCGAVDTMDEENKEEFYGTVEELKERGYVPCGRCRPWGE